MGERRDPRIRTNTRAVVWFGSRAAPFTIDNLSLGGARLIGSMALRLGQHVDIELELDTGPVKVTCEVVRVDTPDLLEDQIAVRFIDPPFDVKSAIREVVMRELADAEPTEQTSPGMDFTARRSDPVIGKLGDDEDVDIEVEPLPLIDEHGDPDAVTKTPGSRPGGSRPGGSKG
jgi:hypothetical protein